MEKNRKIRRKWKMVVAIVFVLAVMIGIGLEEEERSVEGEPDVISILIFIACYSLVHCLMYLSIN